MLREQWVTERPAVLRKPGNAGGGKGPQFKRNVGSSDEARRLGSLSTPEKVQKLLLGARGSLLGLQLLMAVETRLNLAVSGAFASWFAAAR